MIKRVTLRCGGFSYKNFTKYIAENGNAVCAINDEIVEPDVGNDIYRALKEENAVVTNRVAIEMNDEEIVKHLESGIDKYVEYIDNYRQYMQAQEKNNRIRKLISEFRRIAK